MIYGIGIDLIRADRVRTAVERHGNRFLGRVFTAGEQDYCAGKADPWQSYAARFAVKEAVFKALGRGWDECGGFTSVEVTGVLNRRPEVRLHGKAAVFARRYGVTAVHVSITHDGGIAAAVAVIEGAGCASEEEME